MGSNYGRIDIWRNTGIRKLCRLVAGKQVDQTCVGLAPTRKETWARDSPLHSARWRHFQDSIITAQTNDLWQHYFNDFCSCIFA